MEKTKETKIETVKEKKKLTGTHIVKLIMAGFSVVCFILAIVFMFIKTPIKGSIYRINTTQKQRETTWENKRDELYDYFDKKYPASHFENEIDTSSWTKFLYKFSYSNETVSSKQLNIELFNYSEKTIKILGSVHVEHRDNLFDYRITVSQGEVLTVKEAVNYSLIVDSDFDIEDCYISIYNVEYDNDGIKEESFLTAKLYEKELERTKTFKIYDKIEEMIGKRPTNEFESTEPIPDYMVEIKNARLRAFIFFVLSVSFLVLAISVRKTRLSGSDLNIEYFSELENDEPENEIIIKEIHHAPKVKKVICLHCGSRYKDNHDECPNCGSSKIKDETSESN